jgi:hypothetical protein
VQPDNCSEPIPVKRNKLQSGDKQRSIDPAHTVRTDRSRSQANAKLRSDFDTASCVDMKFTEYTVHSLEPVRLSLKAINAELAKHQFSARLGKGDGFFYVWSGEASEWLDRTMRVPRLRSLTLEQWVEELRKLREKNRQLMRSTQKSARHAPKRGVATRGGTISRR